MQIAQKMEKRHDHVSDFTMEAALRFAADTGGEIVIALDEGKRFMTTLMGEYSKGPTSAREKWMEMHVRYTPLPHLTTSGIDALSPPSTTHSCAPVRF